jgi:hypothetical protein
MNRTRYLSVSMLIWAVLGTSCRDLTEDDSAGKDTTVASDDTGESPVAEGLRESLDCVDGSGPFSSVQSSETLVAMVPRISWTASEPLEVRAVTDIGRDAPLTGELQETASDGDVLVLGIPALTEATVVLTAETEQGLFCTQELSIEPASLPPSLPPITLSSFDSERASGGYISTVVITESGRYLVILDELGEYVWALDVGKNSVAGADFADDGQGLVYMRWAEEADADEEPPVPAQPGRVVWVGWDGETQASVDVEESHTDFTELPDGNIITLVRTYRELTSEDGSQQLVMGDGLVEVSRSGEVTPVWDIFDELSPELEPAMNALKSFSHANSVSYHAESDDFLVGLANFNSILRIDHGTGDLIWDLANQDAALVATGEDGEDVIIAPHSAELLAEDSLLLFNRNYDDSGETPITDMCSEAIVLSLDLDAEEAVEVSSYGSDDCVLVVFFGEAIHMDNGNTRVIFSSSGQMSEGTPQGETVWQLNTAVGGAFGFGDWTELLP